VKLPTILFIFSTSLVIASVYLYAEILWIMLFAYAMLGSWVAIILVARMYLYSCILMGFHVAMAYFFGWVFINYALVQPERAFVFSVFTQNNLQLATVTMLASSVVVLVSFLLLVGRQENLFRQSTQQVMHLLLGRLDAMSNRFFEILLLTSFLISILFFATNTSILEVPYPFQSKSHWIPSEALKIPTFLAAFALMLAYVWRGQKRRGSRSRILLARLNFLIVTLFMLFLIGSRGLFTFLWLAVGIVELFFWHRRRGSLGWTVVFFLLTWYAYTVWPYLRWSIASTPIGEVFSESLAMGFGIGSSAAGSYPENDQIRLNDFHMIGQSLFHMLYVIQLIQDGVSLGGDTFVNLIKQLLPGFLDGVIWGRPLNDNLRLEEYYYHGGGFLVVANAYWNGGFWVAMIFMTIFSSVFVLLDRYSVSPRAGVLYRLGYWLWMPVFVVQLGYGIQGIARVAELLVALMIVERIIRAYKARSV